MDKTLRLFIAAASWVWICGCGRVTLMSYNVCGMDPSGGEAFDRKCAVVAAALRRSVPGGPDLVALQEIGDAETLRLLRDGWLRGLGYRWYVSAGDGPPGLRVGMLGRLPLERVMVHLPAPSRSAPSPRPVLEVVCSAGGGSLHVLNNHWKSRIGGAARTRDARIESARVVARRVAGIRAAEPTASIVVVGDLNEDHVGEGNVPDAATAPWRVSTGPPPGRAVILLVDDPGALVGDGGPLRLYEPWFGIGDSGGSYAYGGAWGTPDHILLGSALFDGRGLEYRPGSFRVASGHLLVDPRTGLPRGHGRRGASEYSDHLPIVVTLEAAGRRATAPQRAPPG